jgi:hypothetical protein
MIARRGRFTAPTADLSAPGAGFDYIKYIIGPINLSVYIIFLGWIDPIQKHFIHRYILVQPQQEVERVTAPHLPLERNDALIPCLKDRGFPRRLI